MTELTDPRVVRSRAQSAVVRYVVAVLLLSIAFWPALALLALAPLRYRRAYAFAARGYLTRGYLLAESQRMSGGAW